MCVTEYGEIGVFGGLITSAFSLILNLNSAVYQVEMLHFAFVNPRYACAARVTVLRLCVCLSALILALRATRRPKSNTNGFLDF